MNRTDNSRLTRRQALIAGGAVGAVGGAAGLAALPRHGVAKGPVQTGSNGDEPARRAALANRMPVAFFPHGGGPWPFVDLGLPQTEIDGLTSYLRSVATLPRTPPRAILIVSAHWEEPVPTVMTAAHPPLLYDYSGFPPAAYHLTWPAPGSPPLAQQVRDLLAAGGFVTGADDRRGFDHGTFVPLKLMYPAADLPTVQLSLKAGLDPDQHLAMGRALAPLRDQGVFIVGSGMTFHNLRAFRDPAARPGAQAFDSWLQAVIPGPAQERDAALRDWTRAPAARQAHPREEHLLPLMVVAGAAGDDRAVVAFAGPIMNMPVSAYHFG